MQEAWILARGGTRGSRLAEQLAELGYAPYNLFRGPLPRSHGAGVVRSPQLVVVGADRGESIADDLAGLREEAELAGVPLLVVVEREQLDTAGRLDAHGLLVWPFTTAELRARIRRARFLVSGSAARDVIAAGSLELDLARRQATVEGVPLELTYKEFELLRLLMTQPGRVLAREAVLLQIWGQYGNAAARTTDVHLSRLRAKLGPVHGARITTIRGVGYVFRGGAATSPRPTASAASRRLDDPLSPEHERWIERIVPGALARPELRRRGSAVALAAAVPATLLARGLSRAAPSAPVRIGFVALTDAASVILAHENRLFERRGLNVQLIRLPSWQATRDLLLRGRIDAAHCPFALPFAVATGIGGPAGTTTLKIAMVLGQNGQAITLKREWVAAGYHDLAQARRVMNGGRGHTYAMTFPGGTHDTWLRYWLKAMGVDPSALRIVAVPPPQMVEHLRRRKLDGFCAGEPWNGVAAERGLGFTELATQDLWEFHPEKALVVGADFASARAADLKQVVGGILEASQWLDQPRNRAPAADVLSRPEYVGVPADAIRDRLNGVYELGGGLGTKTFRGDQMRFFGNGNVNAPRRGHAVWFMAQYVRFGYLGAAPRFDAIARELILSDLYREAADAEGVPVPLDDMAPFRIKLDGIEFDPRRPQVEVGRR